jgi:hypothetical protein
MINKGLKRNYSNPVGWVPSSNVSSSYSCKSCRCHSQDSSLLDKKTATLQSPTSDRLSVTQQTHLRLSFQGTSQQHAITGEISSLVQATSWKLVGQHTVEA